MFSFIGGLDGPWRVERVIAVKGESLVKPARVRIVNAHSPDTANAAWTLRGVTSNQRYTTHEENKKLVAVQPALNRPEATLAALIPIRKTAEWWTAEAGVVSRDDSNRFPPFTKGGVGGVNIQP